MIERRAFLGVVTGGLLAAPRAGAAQPAAKGQPRIGYLSGGSDSPRDVAFRQGLRELGYLEGQNIAIEYRFATGQYEALPGFAADLVRLNVDVIVSSSTPAVRAAQHATETIPIVMVLGSPETESIANLGRPGRNITGVSAINWELSGKRLELLKQAVPRLSRVALLGNPDNPTYTHNMTDTGAAARALGLQIDLQKVRSPHDYARAFEAAIRGRADALIGLPDTTMVVHRTLLAELASKYRLPTMYHTREFPESGSLMSYGPNVPELFRRAASYVDKILKGAKPGDLPIEQPTKFELVFNLKTARALGLTIPPSLLQRADHVIE